MLDRPSGDPMATTVWPTTILREEPSGAGRRPLGVLDVEHRDVVDGAAPHDRGGARAAVHVDDVDLGAVLGDLDDVVVGDDVALTVHHEARPGRALGRRRPRR